ncbi:LANO_0C09802g1_1 [Lachancea nothofagi CBS 11611]|uniref:Galactokinase n=1 Tax=Lachancea nothofagi CBS 11611 TaxID=1266666 RepID=A0A1G4JAE5_9SACH|nr:LANO_0C09802g1_1 [Lachancea nothofagi CBS 11611]
MSVPLINSRDLFSKHKTRVDRVVNDFQKVYDEKPDFVSRSPGRVNLIGEHIDYEDFSVLPMAIEADVLCAVGVLAAGKGLSITLTNEDKAFAQRHIELPLDGSDVSIDPSVSDWSNYFKCGLLVAQKQLKTEFPEKFGNASLAGMKVFVSGNVPTGGGLSSSAAFICAVALAVVRANTEKSYKISKQMLTKITVKAEHYVGVNNGGMDQAASVCGEVDHALYVEFQPQLKATSFRFPQLQHSEIQFIIANTMVVSNKVETAPTNYNLRVVEVTVAANVLASKFKVALRKTGNLQKGTLREFMDAYYSRVHGASESWDGNIEDGIKMLNEMLEVVEQTLTQREGYTVEDAAEALQCSVQEFTKDYLTSFPVRFDVLKLYQRAKHVYSESLRVLQALKLLTSRKAGSDEHFLESFGAMMNGSQESCDKLYGCSCPETDELCRIARSNGAYGSRLTGAGWGGCTVHLVTSDNADSVLNALIEQYYRKRFTEMSQEALEEAVLVSKPALGSCVIEL